MYYKDDAFLCKKSQSIAPFISWGTNVNNGTDMTTVEISSQAFFLSLYNGNCTENA